MDVSDWSLKDELLALLRRWYLFAAAVLIGALAGWITASMLPPVYEAEAALVVTFNNDAVFISPDDYKNGQLAELSDFVVSSEVLELTLERLQQLDSHFEGWTAGDLRESIEPRWRNVGTWQLAARDREPGIAAAIAGTWSQVVLEQAGQAIAAAAEFTEIDRRLTALARDLEAVRLDHVIYTVLLHDLETWQAAPGDVEALILLVNRLANLKPRAAAAALPPVDPAALAEDPVAWADAAATALRAQIAFLENVQAEQQAAYDALGDAWLAARAGTYGLSAYLLVERTDKPQTSPIPIYRRGALALAGALIGVLVLLGVRFGRIVFRQR